MTDLRRINIAAVVFLVVLRMAIGWQFFYEGLWKYNTLGTAKEWSSAGYLKNSRGPFRERFVGMVPDPHDLSWLDFDTVSSRWDEWKEKFVEHYDLSDEQQQKLTELLDGHKEFVSRTRISADFEPVPKDNPRRKLIGGTLERQKIVQFRRTDGNKWVVVIDGKHHLTPQERDRLFRGAAKIEAAYRKDAQRLTGKAAKRAARVADLVASFPRALRDAYKRNAKLSFREQLGVLLKGDPERVTKIQKDKEGTIDYKKPGEIGQYKDRLARMDAMLSGARTAFQEDHLHKEQQEIAKLHAKLVGPVKKLERDLQQAALNLLTEEQRAQATIPMTEPTSLERTDKLVMWSLMILGVLLMIGLLSRSTALAGGLLVLSFYLVIPPFPGVPQPPGPEHSVLINKNLIEVLALFALALVPTGKYFGVDSFFVGCCAATARRTKRQTATPPKQQPAVPRPEPKRDSISDTLRPPDPTPADTYVVKKDT